MLIVLYCIKASVKHLCCSVSLPAHKAMREEAGSEKRKKWRYNFRANKIESTFQQEEPIEVKDQDSSSMGSQEVKWTVGKAE